VGRDFGGKQPDLAFQALEMRCGDPRAITPPHQHAILGFAEIRDAHGEPDSDGGQSYGKGKGRNVRQHAMAKVVRLVSSLLVRRQIVRFRICALTERLLAQIASVWRTRHGARPEFKHPVLFLGRDGLLGIHCFQLRYTLY
jgi:hypothetical protein